MSFKFFSTPISAALGGAKYAISVAKGVFGGSGRQVLDRKVNPKPEQDTSPQTPQAPLKLPRAIVFGDEKVFG